MSFQLGRIVSTPGALRALEAARTSPKALIERHAAGDWGDLSASDKRANEQALKDGGRILSAYDLGNGSKVWIVTEAENEGKRASTCLLRPDEY